jgi:hypothetical protein
VSGPKAEFREQRPDPGWLHVRRGGPEGAYQRLVGQEQIACLLDLADNDASAQRGMPLIQRDPAQQRPQQRRLA